MWSICLLDLGTDFLVVCHQEGKKKAPPTDVRSDRNVPVSTCLERVSLSLLYEQLGGPVDESSPGGKRSLKQSGRSSGQKSAVSCLRLLIG